MTFAHVRSRCETGCRSTSVARPSSRNRVRGRRAREWRARGAVGATSRPRSADAVTLVVVSPHLDDAALSMRHALAANPGSVVATVCTWVPPESFGVTGWDALTGATSSHACMLRRCEEDARGVALLGGRHIHLNLRDQQYGPRSFEDVVTAIEWLISQSADGSRFCGPAGIGHGDHVQVADAFLEAVQRKGLSECWRYEELPYRSEGHDVASRLASVPESIWTQSEVDLGRGDPAVAEAGLQAYRSQLPLLEARPYRDPERYWRLHAR